MHCLLSSPSSRSLPLPLVRGAGTRCHQRLDRAADDPQVYRLEAPAT